MRTGYLLIVILCFFQVACGGSKTPKVPDVSSDVADDIPVVIQDVNGDAMDTGF